MATATALREAATALETAAAKSLSRCAVATFPALGAIDPERDLLEQTLAVTATDTALRAPAGALYTDAPPPYPDSIPAPTVHSFSTPPATVFANAGNARVLRAALESAAASVASAIPLSNNSNGAVPSTATGTGAAGGASAPGSTGSNSNSNNSSSLSGGSSSLNAPSGGVPSTLGIGERPLFSAQSKYCVADQATYTALKRLHYQQQQQQQLQRTSSQQSQSHSPGQGHRDSVSRSHHRDKGLDRDRDRKDKDKDSSRAGPLDNPRDRDRAPKTKEEEEKDRAARHARRAARAAALLDYKEKEAAAAAAQGPIEGVASSQTLATNASNANIASTSATASARPSVSVNVVAAAAGSGVVAASVPEEDEDEDNNDNSTNANKQLESSVVKKSVVKRKIIRKVKRPAALTDVNPAAAAVSSATSGVTAASAGAATATAGAATARATPLDGGLSTPSKASPVKPLQMQQLDSSNTPLKLEPPPAFSTVVSSNNGGSANVSAHSSSPATPLPGYAQQQQQLIQQQQQQQQQQDYLDSPVACGSKNNDGITTPLLLSQNNNGVSFTAFHSANHSRSHSLGLGAHSAIAGVTGAGGVGVVAEADEEGLALAWALPPPAYDTVASGLDWQPSRNPDDNDDDNGGGNLVRSSNGDDENDLVVNQNNSDDYDDDEEDDDRVHNNRSNRADNTDDDDDDDPADGSEREGLSPNKLGRNNGAAAAAAAAAATHSKSNGNSNNSSISDSEGEGEGEGLVKGSLEILEEGQITANGSGVVQGVSGLSPFCTRLTVNPSSEPSLSTPQPSHSATAKKTIGSPVNRPPPLTLTGPTYTDLNVNITTTITPADADTDADNIVNVDAMGVPATAAPAATMPAPASARDRDRVAAFARAVAAATADSVAAAVASDNWHRVSNRGSPEKANNANATAEASPAAAAAAYSASAPALETALTTLVSPFLVPPPSTYDSDGSAESLHGDISSGGDFAAVAGAAAAAAAAAARLIAPATAPSVSATGRVLAATPLLRCVLSQAASLALRYGATLVASCSAHSDSPALPVPALSLPCVSLNTLNTPGTGTGAGAGAGAGKSDGTGCVCGLCVSVTPARTHSARSHPAAVLADVAAHTAAVPATLASYCVRMSNLDSAVAALLRLEATVIAHFKKAESSTQGRSPPLDWGKYLALSGLAYTTKSKSAATSASAADSSEAVKRVLCVPVLRLAARALAQQRVAIAHTAARYVLRRMLGDSPQRGTLTPGTLIITKAKGLTAYITSF